MLWWIISKKTRYLSGLVGIACDSDICRAFLIARSFGWKSREFILYRIADLLCLQMIAKDKDLRRPNQSWAAIQKSISIMHRGAKRFMCDAPKPFRVPYHPFISIMLDCKGLLKEYPVQWIGMVWKTYMCSFILKFDSHLDIPFAVCKLPSTLYSRFRFFAWRFLCQAIILLF